MENFKVAQAEYEHKLDCPFDDEEENNDNESLIEAMIDEYWLF